MAAATIQTRQTTISARKLAFQGRDYEAEWIGTDVVYTTFEGDRLEGTIARFSGGYPVAVFPDGRWVRLDLTIEVVV